MTSQSEDKLVRDVGEFGLIARIAEIVLTADSVAGLGDDTAVLDQPGDTYLLATTDMLVEDVHFRRSLVVPFDLGRRAIAINVSDIASMGGRPTYALTSIAAPPELRIDFVEQLYRGMKYESDRFSLQIVGGNTTRIQQELVLDVALLGWVAKGDVVLRRGARLGDIVAVTGSLGRAAAVRLFEEKFGVAERRRRYPEIDGLPDARLHGGRALASAKLAHAMIDLSDGLAGDAHHLARASEVCLLIDEDSLPIDRATGQMADELGLDPYALAMTGGEDYELLVALDPATFGQAQAEVHPVLFTSIGEVLAPGYGVRLLTREGVLRDLKAEGWTHF